MTPLMLASLSGSFRVTKVLSILGSIEDHVDKLGRNVFHLAVISKSAETVEVPCQNTSAKKLFNQFDNNQMAPIHYAVEEGDCSCVEVLLAHKVYQNIRSKNIPPPIITAALKGDTAMVTLLNSYKANIKKTNKAGNTALHVAGMANHADTVLELLHLGADINTLNHRLQSPLNAAVEQGSIEATEILLLAGSNSQQVDRTAKTPLTMASQSGFVRVVDMLIRTERWREKNPTQADLIASTLHGTPGEDSEESGDSLSQAETFTGSLTESEIRQRVMESKMLDSSIFFQENENDLASPKSSNVELPSNIKIDSEYSFEDYEKYEESHADQQGSPDISEMNSLEEKKGKSNVTEYSSPHQSRTQTNVSESIQSTENGEKSLAFQKLAAHKSPILRGRKKIINNKPRVLLQSMGRQFLDNYSRQEESDFEDDDKGEDNGRVLGSEEDEIENKRDVTSSNEEEEEYYDDDEEEYDDKTREEEEEEYDEGLRGEGSEFSEDSSDSTTSEASSVIVGPSRPDFSLLDFNQPHAAQMQLLLYYIAYNKLKSTAWKKLAYYWKFTEEQIEAIAMNHAHSSSAYKDHGFRMMSIWLHGVGPEEDLNVQLYAGLVAIGCKRRADRMAKDYHRVTHGQQKKKISNCRIS